MVHKNISSQVTVGSFLKELCNIEFSKLGDCEIGEINYYSQELVYKVQAEIEKRVKEGKI